ncbi:hypothetical protein POM88_018577 [Heracleum sosnowskyi]|uniref:Uncharacterized protein n=1 Tax=Heracleum sosnowskyi TaxID=360622 RepID=A0AAD8IQT4_9APIA|nr:hypothetical protein POM88_018577 [Heracleum sosnowskyi]
MLHRTRGMQNDENENTTTGNGNDKFYRHVEDGKIPLSIKVLKCQFVTTHQLQQQQRTKKCTEVCSPRKSARLNNAPVKISTEVKSYRKSGESAEVTSARKSARPMSARPEINDMISKQKPKSTEKKGARKSTPINNQASDENVNLKSSSVRRKLDLHNPRDEDENMDENDIQIEDLPLPPPIESSPVKPLTITEYEMIKLQNIRRNNEKLKALNLPTLDAEMVDSMKKNKGKRKRRDENAYVPENDDQSGYDASESVPKKTKNLKKNKLRTGPTTRLRATALTATENGSTQNDTSEKDAANSVLVQPIAQIQLPCAEGVGTMANYLAMQERKRKQAANDVAASGSGTKSDRVPETDMPFFKNEEGEPAVILSNAILFPRNKKKKPERELTQGLIFSKTRKRKHGRKYKTNPEVMNFRIETIKKKLNSSKGVDGIEELVSGGKKSHGSGWLIGRHDSSLINFYSGSTSNRFVHRRVDKKDTEGPC